MKIKIKILDFVLLLLLVFFCIFTNAESNEICVQAENFNLGCNCRIIDLDNNNNTKEYSKKDDRFLIVIDPGHGGKAPGAVCCDKNNNIIKEKDLNLKLARLVREGLSNYATENGRKIRVILTHEIENEEEEPPSLENRVSTYPNAKAVISLHFNSSRNPDTKGAFAIVTAANYFPYLYIVSEGLGKKILYSLAKNVGIKTISDFENTYADAPDSKKSHVTCKEGMFRRFSEDETKYSNGETADYYAIVKHGVRYGIPAIIVEHCCISNSDDVEYISDGSGISEIKLRKIAAADVSGIVSYFGLRKISITKF